jgi:REP-associated tyrosine transposase
VVLTVQQGGDFEHRKQWIVMRMKQLASVFCMDVCAYAVMSNHYHVVLRVDTEEAIALSDEAVLQRWQMLFSGNMLVSRYLSDKQGDMDAAEKDKVREIAQEWRGRLMDISWFMRCMNESIARMANKEDGCKGRFWEGRFKSQALLDEAALLACMVYVDLNPVRAGMAETPEASDFTSIQERIRKHMQTSIEPENLQTSNATALLEHEYDKQTLDQSLKLPVKPLLDLFVKNQAAPSKGIVLSLEDYMELVDWTGRAIIDDKHGHIPGQLSTIISRLQVNPDYWVGTVKNFNRCFPRVAGHVARLKMICQKLNLAWVHGMGASKCLFIQSI